MIELGASGDLAEPRTKENAQPVVYLDKGLVRTSEVEAGENTAVDSTRIFHGPLGIAPDPEPEPVAEIREGDAIAFGLPGRGKEREPMHGFEGGTRGRAEGMTVPVADSDGRPVAGLRDERPQHGSGRQEEEPAGEEYTHTNGPDERRPAAARLGLSRQAAR